MDDDYLLTESFDLPHMLRVLSCTSADIVAANRCERTHATRVATQLQSSRCCRNAIWRSQLLWPCELSLDELNTARDASDIPIQRIFRGVRQDAVCATKLRRKGGVTVASAVGSYSQK